jgi:hypothetical protein
MHLKTQLIHFSLFLLDQHWYGHCLGRKDMDDWKLYFW